jgi:DNA repair and recombination RAD54-like protein
LGFDSASKEQDNNRQHKVQSIKFLCSLERPSENSVIASKNGWRQIEQSFCGANRTKGKNWHDGSDSDDEDGNNSGYNKLVPMIKELTSEVACNIAEYRNPMGSAKHLKPSMLKESGQSAAVVNKFLWKPDVNHLFSLIGLVCRKGPTCKILLYVAFIRI